MTGRQRTAALVVAVLVLAAAGTAVARVGGGQSYSHGGSSGGGDDGSGALIQLVFWLLLRHPAIGVPVLIVVILFFLWSKRSGFVTAEIGPGRTTYSRTAPAPRRRAPAGFMPGADGR